MICYSTLRVDEKTSVNKVIFWLIFMFVITSLFRIWPVNQNHKLQSIDVSAISYFLTKSKYNRESQSYIKWSRLLCERSVMKFFDSYWDMMISMPRLQSWTDGVTYRSTCSVSKSAFYAGVRRCGLIIMPVGH